MNLPPLPPPLAPLEHVIDVLDSPEPVESEPLGLKEQLLALTVMVKNFQEDQRAQHEQVSNLIKNSHSKMQQFITSVFTKGAVKASEPTKQAETVAKPLVQRSQRI